MDFAIFIFVVLVVVAYFISTFFSFILNGIIILTATFTKSLHTPTTMIIVNLSVASIIPVIMSPLTAAAFLTATLSCDCTILYYRWIIWQTLLFGIYPFNVLLLSIAYLLVLKFSKKFLTLTKAAIGIALIWILSILCNLPTPFIATKEEFVDCCETVCMNGTALCNTSLLQTFTPRTFNINAGKYYQYRDLVTLWIPSLLIFIASACSYYIYKRSSMGKLSKNTAELELRMFFSPVILTFLGGGYFLLEDVINWVDTAIDDDRFPGIIVYVTLHAFWDTTGVTFALIVLFFNVSIRKKVKELIFTRIWKKNEEGRSVTL